MAWFWKHRETIAQIISIALLFAENEPKEVKPAPKRSNDDKGLVRPGSRVPPKSDVMQELTEETERLGLYDLGTNNEVTDELSE